MCGREGKWRESMCERESVRERVCEGECVRESV